MKNLIGGFEVQGGLMAKYFPLFIDISKKTFLVVGAGNISARRVLKLKEFGCKIIVVAKTISATIMDLEDEKLILKERAYDSTDIEDADYVIAATNDKELNEKIVWDCNKEGIPVNDASNYKNCDFYFPGIVTEDEMVIGVTSSGSNHKLARRVAGAIRYNIKEIVSECKKEQESDTKQEEFD